MKITIDTETDTFESSVEAVCGAYGQPKPWQWEDEDTKEVSDNPAMVKNGASNLLPGGWNEKKLRKWVSYLTANAQAVSLFVAQSAPEVSFEAVAAHLGDHMGLTEPVDGKLLGGTMSSGGHALKHIAGVKSQPFDRDWSRGLYVIDARVAKILVDELS